MCIMTLILCTLRIGWIIDIALCTEYPFILSGRGSCIPTFWGRESYSKKVRIQDGISIACPNEPSSAPPVTALTTRLKRPAPRGFCTSCSYFGPNTWNLTRPKTPTC